MKIQVQTQDFSLQEEVERLRQAGAGTGAIVSFVGLVRDYHEDQPVQALTLEHYPAMTEKSLRQIAAEASQRWPLLDLTIIHRVGELMPADQIVLVVVSSAHRAAAFSACEFVMDYLKTRAPFWKKTRSDDSEFWVQSRSTDDEAAKRW